MRAATLSPDDTTNEHRGPRCLKTAAIPDGGGAFRNLAERPSVTTDKYIYLLNVKDEAIMVQESLDNTGDACLTFTAEVDHDATRRTRRARDASRANYPRGATLENSAVFDLRTTIVQRVNPRLHRTCSLRHFSQTPSRHSLV